MGTILIRKTYSSLQSTYDDDIRLATHVALPGWNPDGLTGGGQVYVDPDGVPYVAHTHDDLTPDVIAKLVSASWHSLVIDASNGIPEGFTKQEPEA